MTSPDIISTLKTGITTNGPDATLSMATSLAKAIPPNTTLTLRGELGAGKTTFVRGMARAWGIAENINSPTYNIVFVYKSELRTLVHMDAYRLEKENSLSELMLEDLLIPPWCLAVEWPENLNDALPGPIWHLAITHVSETERGFKLEIQGPN